jgi:hypothetical protein
VSSVRTRLFEAKCGVTCVAEPSSLGNQTVRLIKLVEFRRVVYSPESAPSMNTLRKKFDHIPGATILHGQRYIDMDEFDRVHGLRAKVATRIAEIESDPLLKGLV